MKISIITSAALVVLWAGNAVAFAEDSQPGSMEFGTVYDSDGNSSRYMSTYWPYGTDASGGSETIIENLDTGETSRVIRYPSISDSPYGE